MRALTDGWITLRPPRRNDAAAVAASVQASLAELEPWMPWASAQYDEAAAREWIELPGEHPFLILDATGRHLGTCGLNAVDVVNRRANLGYWVRTDRTGAGIATAATRLLVTHALETLRLGRIEIVMSVHNHASRRVAERVGAIYEGTLRKRLVLQGRPHDAHLYAIVAPDAATTG